MNKIYKLLIESPEYPKGTEAKYDTETKNYDLYLPSGQLIEGEDRNGEEYNAWLHVGQVENRPDIWKLKEEEKEVVENEYRCFIPEPEENFFYIISNGVVKEVTNTCSKLYISCIEQGVYRTERAAQMEAKRRESRAKAWMPEEHEKYYAVETHNEFISTTTWQNCTIDKDRYLIGNIHRTKEDAKKWKDEYWEAFNCLF